MHAPDEGQPIDDLVGRKAALRDRITARRGEFERVRTQVSAAIVGHLVANERWVRASRAMAYLAMRSEVDLDALWSASPRPEIGIPLVDAESTSMGVRSIRDPARDVVPGAFGVRAPSGRSPVLEPASIDLVLVPGLAFDIAGNRLGRGGGYYDRFLAGLAGTASDAAIIGVCWSGQIISAVPTGPHDQRVRMLLTEHGLERCRG